MQSKKRNKQSKKHFFIDACCPLNHRTSACQDNVCALINCFFLLVFLVFRELCFNRFGINTDTWLFIRWLPPSSTLQSMHITFLFFFLFFFVKMLLFYIFYFFSKKGAKKHKVFQFHSRLKCVPVAFASFHIYFFWILWLYFSSFHA